MVILQLLELKDAFIFGCTGSLYLVLGGWGAGGGGREVQSLFKKLEEFHSDEVSVAENSPS